MRKLFRFFANKSYFFLFLILEVTSFLLYLSNEKYPKSVFFSSANSVVSQLYESSSWFTEFFTLREVNKTLSIQNTALENRIVALENLLEQQSFPKGPDSILKIFPEKDYAFIAAKLINNSTRKLRNFITLNVGASNGVRPDMGVVGPEGVVGIVKTVSDKFSVAVSLLNSMTQISSKIKQNNYVGRLVWEGADYRYAYLKDIPRHIKLEVGDSIVTSGLTCVFPEGVPLGVIDDFVINDGYAFYEIRVRLAVNFKLLSYVNVIDYKNYSEQSELEQAED